MHIGPFRLESRLILAPMAGVTDRPFRAICRRYGAALAVSEMVSSKPELQDGRKTLLRCDHQRRTGAALDPDSRGRSRHDMAEAAA